MNQPRATSDVGGVRAACSVCAGRVESVEQPASPGRPGLTCGLCGAVIFLPASDVIACQSCGEPIVHAADGMKLCDGRIVHTVCGRRH